MRPPVRLLSAGTPRVEQAERLRHELRPSGQAAELVGFFETPTLMTPTRNRVRVRVRVGFGVRVRAKVRVRVRVRG